MFIKTKKGCIGGGAVSGLVQGVLLYRCGTILDPYSALFVGVVLGLVCGLVATENRHGLLSRVPNAVIVAALGVGLLMLFLLIIVKEANGVLLYQATNMLVIAAAAIGSAIAPGKRIIGFVSGCLLMIIILIGNKSLIDQRAFAALLMPMLTGVLLSILCYAFTLCALWLGERLIKLV